MEPARSSWKLMERLSQLETSATSNRFINFKKDRAAEIAALYLWVEFFAGKSKGGTPCCARSAFGSQKELTSFSWETALSKPSYGRSSKPSAAHPSGDCSRHIGDH